MLMKSPWPELLSDVNPLIVDPQDLTAESQSYSRNFLPKLADYDIVQILIDNDAIRIRGTPTWAAPT